MRFEGIGSKVFIEGVGTFAVEFFPEKYVTYEDMLTNKKYIARKVIEQLNKVYKQAEVDMNE